MHHCNKLAARLNAQRTGAPEQRTTRSRPGPSRTDGPRGGRAQDPAPFAPDTTRGLRDSVRGEEESDTPLR